MEIYNDKQDPVNFDSANINDVMHEGYVFQEDFFTMNNDINGPEILDI